MAYDCNKKMKAATCGYKETTNIMHGYQAQLGENISREKDNPTRIYSKNIGQTEVVSKANLSNEVRNSLKIIKDANEQDNIKHTKKKCPFENLKSLCNKYAITGINGCPVTDWKTRKPSVTNVKTGSKIQTTEPVTKVKNIPPVQSYKDFSLPENNMFSYNMKISDRSALSYSALPDLETFGRELQEARAKKPLQSSPPLILKSVYGSSSNLANDNTFQQLRKLNQNWKNIQAVPDCNIKTKSSFEQTISCSKEISVSNSTNTACSSESLNQSDSNSKDFSKSKGIGYTQHEVNNDKQSCIPISHNNKQFTKESFKTYPKSAISYNVNKQDKGQHKRKHVSFSILSSSYGAFKHEVQNKNKLNMGRTFPNFKGSFKCPQGNLETCNNGKYVSDMKSHPKKTKSSSNIISISSQSTVTVASQLTFKQHEGFLDENTPPRHKQKVNSYNTEHSIVKSKNIELNKKNSLNISTDKSHKTKRKECLGMKTETMKVSTVSRYKNNCYSSRPRSACGIDYSRKNYSVLENQIDLTDDNQSVNPGINNGCPTNFTKQNKSLEDTLENVLETKDHNKAIAKSNETLKLDVYPCNDVENEREGKELPVLFDIQNELYEISESQITDNEQSENKGIREHGVSNTENLVTVNSENKAKINNVASTMKKSENELDFNVNETTKLVLNEVTGIFIDVADNTSLSEIGTGNTTLPKGETSFEQEILKTPENPKSITVLDSPDSCITSDDSMFKCMKDCKIGEKYKYPQVVLSPLKMTKRLEDMINEYIAKKKLDSPILPVFPSILETPITTRNAQDSPSPKLSPIPLPIPSEKIYIGNEKTETCRTLTKKNRKRKSRSKMMKGLLPSRHYDREKTLIETAENFLGDDFLKKSGRKRKGAQEISFKNVKRSKKANRDNKVVLTNNEELSYGKQKFELLSNNHFMDKETRKTETFVADSFSTGLNGTKTLEAEITVERHVVDDTNEGGKSFLRSEPKKRKKHWQFSTRNKTEDVNKVKHCKTKSLASSPTFNSTKRSKHRENKLVMKLFKDKVETPFSDNQVMYKVKKGIDETDDRQGDKDKVRDNQCIIKSLKSAEKKNERCIEHKGLNIFKVPNTVKTVKEKKSATKCRGDRQHKGKFAVSLHDDSKAITNDKRLIIQTSLKNKCKTTCHKINESFKPKADLSMSERSDEKDKIKSANNCLSGAKITAVSDKSNKVKKTDKESTVITKSDCYKENKKTFRDSKRQRKKREKLEVVNSKSIDDVQDKSDNNLNDCIERHKPMYKKISESVISPVDEDTLQQNRDGKTQDFEESRSQTWRGRENSEVANKNIKTLKRSNGQDSVLLEHLPKTKRTYKKRKRQVICNDENTDSVPALLENKPKPNFPKKTVNKICNFQGETKKDALKTQRIVSEHLKKVNKDSEVGKRQLKSKSVKKDVKHDGQVVCQICKKTFATKRLLNGHTVVCHPYRCIWCKLEFDSKDASKRHYFTHMKATYQCDLCNMKYGNQLTYELHLRSRRHIKALRNTGVHANEENFELQDSQMNPEIVIENVENCDDQHTFTESVTQFYSDLQQNSQLSLCDFDVSNNNSEAYYCQTGYYDNGTEFLPSHNVSTLSTNMNTDISKESSQSQNVKHFSGSNPIDNATETSSVFVENGKVYAQMSNVRVGDSVYKEITDYNEYSEMTEEELMHPDQLADSTLLCRIANSFSLSK